MHRRPIQDNSTREMHQGVSDYLVQLNMLLKQGEIPDSLRIAKWQVHRAELEPCIGGHRMLLVNVPESAKQHTELIRLVDGILDRLPALPDASETSQLSREIHKLTACRERTIWY